MRFKQLAVMMALLSLSLMRPLQPAWAGEKADIMPPIPGDFYEQVPFDRFIRVNESVPKGDLFDIRAFGAVGDGKTVNTRAINAAIQAAQAKGGGIVLIPDGDYVTGTIKLAGDITLHIARNGILHASRDSADYAPFAMLLCENAANVVVQGPGRILGDGEAWWNPPRKIPPRHHPDTFSLEAAMAMHFDAKRQRASRRPSPFLQFRECTNLTVRNLIIENSPGWTLLLNHCDGVHVKDVVINNNYHGPNTDGINVVGSNRVHIQHCFVATGDDGIVLKNGLSPNQQPMSHIRISDCSVMSSTNCFKIGTETVNDITDVEVADCTFFVDGIWPGGLSGMAIESVDGAHVKRVNIRNVTVRNAMAPIFIRLGNRNRGKIKDRMGALTDVTIRDVRAEGAESPCIISGIPGLYVKNVTLKNIDITYRQAKEQLDIKDPVPEVEAQYPEFAMFGDLPAYGLWARHVDGLTVKNFTVTPRACNSRAKFVLQDVLRAQLPGKAGK